MDPHRSRILKSLNQTGSLLRYPTMRRVSSWMMSLKAFLNFIVMIVYTQQLEHADFLQLVMDVS
jgi:hypothetical protein